MAISENSHLNSLLHKLLFREVCDTTTLPKNYYLMSVIILQGLTKIKMHNYYDAYANELLCIKYNVPLHYIHIVMRQ